MSLLRLWERDSWERKLNTEGPGMAEIGWGHTIPPTTEGFRVGGHYSAYGRGVLGMRMGAEIWSENGA